MVFDYDNSLISVKRLLSLFGGTITLTRKSISTDFDPDTQATENASSVSTGNGVILDFSNKDRATTRVEEGDRKLILDPNDFLQPNIGDVITDVTGTKFSIKETMPVNPAGTPVLWIARIGK